MSPHPDSEARHAREPSALGLNHWPSEEGLSILRRWAEEFLRKHPAGESGEEAPIIAAKQDLIEEGRSEREKLARGLALEALGTQGLAA